MRGFKGDGQVGFDIVLTITAGFIDCATDLTEELRMTKEQTVHSNSIYSLTGYTNKEKCTI